MKKSHDSTIEAGEDVTVTGSRNNHLPDGRFQVLSVHDFHCVIKSYKNRNTYPVDTQYLKKIVG